jgi:hypothetical protein
MQYGCQPDSNRADASHHVRPRREGEAAKASGARRDERSAFSQAGDLDSRIVRHDAVFQAPPHTASGGRVAGGLAHGARGLGIKGMQRRTWRPLESQADSRERCQADGHPGAGGWRCAGLEAGIVIQAEPMSGSQVPVDHRRKPRSTEEKTGLSGHVSIMTAQYQPGSSHALDPSDLGDGWRPASCGPPVDGPLALVHSRDPQAGMLAGRGAGPRQ